ncbi:1029_t:CDS:2, partial [Racocetra persica]
MSAVNKEPESTMSNDSVTSDITQTSLKSNLNRLSVEALRFVCRGMGLSEMGQKQKIVSRLLKESRNRLGPEESVEDAGVTGDRAQRPVMGENSLGAYGKQGLMGQDFSPNDIERRSVWTKRELTKQRNQCEYNEWCRAGVLMDKALALGDINYIRMARQVAMEKAYVIR